MTKKAVFDGMLRAAASESHPGQQLLSFVFTDYKPNKNKQGVPREEAENIISTGLNMPVKISFASRKPKGHLGAFPIGPILSLREEEDRIIGEAIVWKNELPDVAEYLAKASAESNGVHFSWELLYEDSNIDAEGIQWLKGIVTSGITIVDTPAYQGRTPLLALAEEQLFMDELQKQLDELKKQVSTLTAAVAEKDKKISDLESAMAEVQKERDTLNTEAEELRVFKASAEKAQAEAVVLDARRTKMAEAGLDESVFAKRKGTILTMTDEAFNAYVDDLAAVAKHNKASASANDKIIIPDPVTSDNAPKQFTAKDFAKALRTRG
jgi:hypothetical protein